MPAYIVKVLHLRRRQIPGVTEQHIVIVTVYPVASVAALSSCR